ncbi:SEC-C domain-containing protein [Candidatus Shapirobacteria bacterium]|nr:SEC-C domain-containing protein [Candidatus Shapirobacteria bacterium]
MKNNKKETSLPIFKYHSDPCGSGRKYKQCCGK